MSAGRANQLKSAARTGVRSHEPGGETCDRRAADRYAMYGLAYVLVPAEFTSLQAELDRALAPFQRGGDERFPRDKLAFDDATEALLRLHNRRVHYDAGKLIWRDHWREPDFAGSFYLDLAKLSEHMAACRLTMFEGTFAEIEPDFDAFVRPVHPVFRARPGHVPLRAMAQSDRHLGLVGAWRPLQWSDSRRAAARRGGARDLVRSEPRTGNSWQHRRCFRRQAQR